MCAATSAAFPAHLPLFDHSGPGSQDGAMKVTHDFPVTPAELFTSLVDPAYLAARQEKFGGIGDPTVESDDGDGDGRGQIVITSRRQLPLDKVPGAFRGFVGDGQIVQVDTWHASDDGDTSPNTPAQTGVWSAKVGSAPATIGGTHEISPMDAGSQYAIGIEVSINIPFVGSKFEPQVASYLEQLITKELEYLGEWLNNK